MTTSDKFACKRN